MSSKVRSAPCLRVSSLAGQFETAPVDTGLHRALRQPQPSGDLLVGQFLDVPQHDGLAEDRSQRAHRLIQPLAPNAALERD